MLRLSTEGVSGWEIFARLKITPQQAEKIHYELLKKKQIDPDISLNFTQPRLLEVNPKGYVILSAGRFAALDLEKIFSSGTKLNIKRQGNGYLILPDEKEEDSQHSDLSSSEEHTSNGEEVNGSTAEIVQHEVN